MAQHLAVFWPAQLERVLNGTKQVDARITQTRIAPFGVASHGDEIFMKGPGGSIVGKAEIDNVLYYENLDGEALGKLRKEYAQDLGVDETFWKKKENARYATILFLKNPQRFLAPLKSHHKDRRPWVVLNN